MKETSSSSTPPLDWQELKSEGKVLYVATVEYRGKKYTVQTEETNPEIRKALLESISTNDSFLSNVSERFAQGEKKHAFVPFSIREEGDSKKAEISEPFFQEAFKTDQTFQRQFFILDREEPSNLSPPPPKGVSPGPSREPTPFIPDESMDDATRSRFQKFRTTPGKTLFLFKKNNTSYLVEKKNDSLFCREIDIPSPGSPVRMTPYLKNLLSTYPQEVNDLLNQAQQTKQNLSQQSLSNGSNLFCVKEADGSFTILDKLPVLETAYIVAGGSMLLTPSKTLPLMTLTVKVKDSYVKLRDIPVYPRARIVQGPNFNPDAWLSLGSGEFALLVKKEDLENKLQNAPPETKTIFSSFSCNTEVLPVAPGARKTGDVATAAFTNATTFEERSNAWAKLQTGNKITTVMSPDGELVLVASKKIGEGTYKIVKKVQLLWIGKETDIAKIGAEVAIAKAKRATDEFGNQLYTKDWRPLYYKEELLDELPIAKQLTGVPFTLSMREVKRANSAKSGLWLELCEEGDLYTYLSKNPDPEIRKKLMIQLAKGLIGMHKKGLVHSDMKLTNVLVTNTADGPQVRIIDFGLTQKKGTKIQHIAGTFPPLPFMNEYNKQTIEEKTTGKRTGIEITESVDAWAFGLILFAFMKEHGSLVNSISFDKWDSLPQGKTMKDRVEKTILPQVQSNDPVDQAIMGLLDPDRPITLQEALDILEPPSKDIVKEKPLPQVQSDKSVSPPLSITPQESSDTLEPPPQFIKIPTSTQQTPQPPITKYFFIRLITKIINFFWSLGKKSY